MIPTPEPRFFYPRGAPRLGPVRAAQSLHSPHRALRRAGSARRPDAGAPPPSTASRAIRQRCWRTSARCSAGSANRPRRTCPHALGRPHRPNLRDQSRTQRPSSATPHRAPTGRTRAVRTSSKSPPLASCLRTQGPLRRSRCVARQCRRQSNARDKPWSSAPCPSPRPSRA